MSTTTIEWTDTTWNPTTGCDRISAGCDNCYALTMAKRLKAMGSAKYQTDGDPRTSGPGFGIAGHVDVLAEPLRWRKPRRVFVNSMSDLFHARVTTDLITRVWEVMAKTPQHTYQVLTKRASRLAPVLAKVHAELGLTEPLSNVWLGTSVENQKYADLRIPALLNTPAAIRFLSCEPLLGPVNLSRYVWDEPSGLPGDWERGIDWVITGGESGPGARPADPNWFRTIRDQCTAAGVAYLHKQNGEWAPTGYRVIGATSYTTPEGQPRLLVGEPLDDMGHREEIARVGKKRAGRELDGRTWDEYPTAVTV